MVRPLRAASRRSRAITRSSILSVVFIWKTISKIWQYVKAGWHELATARVCDAPLWTQDADFEGLQQYFSDGLSEDLITAMSQFAGLKVISRDSSFQFRNSTEGSVEIGKKLDVAHLLEGSVQRAADEVRIGVELVNAADGATLWSQRYDRPYKDLFALQDAITKAVARALKAKLLTAPGAVVQTNRPPSGDLSAYNAYLQGQFYYQRATEVSLRRAIAQFAEATRLDPHYAAAYAGASEAWTLLAGYFFAVGDKPDAYSKGQSR